MDSYKLTDTDELLSLIRSGENADDAFCELVSRYTQLINKRISAVEVPAGDEAEAVQEASIALHNAAMTYDGEKCRGVTFGLYAGICISNRLISMLREKARRKERTGDGIDVEVIPSGIDVERAVAARDLCDRVMAKARSLLSELEFRVFCLSYEGYSVKDIAERLSVSSKSIENARFRVSRRLRENRDICEILSRM